jgi:hypothetical protein
MKTATEIINIIASQILDSKEHFIFAPQQNPNTEEWISERQTLCHDGIKYPKEVIQINDTTISYYMIHENDDNYTEIQTPTLALYQ